MTAVELRAGSGHLSGRLARVWSDVASVSLCLMVTLEYSGGFGVLDHYFPVSLFTGCLALATTVAVLRLLWAPTVVPWSPVLALIGYLLAETVSYVVSDLSPATTGAEVIEALKLVAYLTVMCVLAAGLREWHRVALAIVVPMAAISLLAAANEFLLGNTQSFLGFETVTDYLGVGVETARHAGPLPDPNFWGRFLVIGLPFALALFQRARATGRRASAGGALVAGALLLGGIYLTGSRGTFLAGLVAVGSYLLCVGVRLRRLLIAVPAVGLLLLVPGVGSRLLTLGPEADLGQPAAGDLSVAARLATQKVAWTMVQDRPITGVGPGGYFDAFGRYAANGEASIDRVIAPHNLYLGLWAQVGILGLLTFCAVLLVGLVLSGRALWATRGMTSADSRRIRPYAAALLAATAAWCAASVFLHLTYARVLLILVVLSAVLWQQARAVPQVRSTASSSESLRRGGVVVTAAVLGAGVAFLALTLVPHGVVATRTAVIEPVKAQDGLGSYLSSLRTRTGIIPGYAVVVAAASPQPVTAQGSVQSGTVTVTANGSSPAAAKAKIAGAVRDGNRAVHRVGMDQVFTMEWQPATSVTGAKPALTTGGLTALGGAAAGAGLGSLVAHRWGHSRRRSRR